MPIVDRMEFPRRFKLKETVLVLIIIGAIFGIWVQRRSLNKLSTQIVITQVKISRSGSQFIELEYMIANLASRSEEVKLLAKVWDKDGNELASSLFSIELPANSSASRSKLLDKLNRTLKDGETPAKAEISLYTRKVP
ncbi:MAG: hypothetical protein RBS43_11570 [Candidatus Cloacimonas sp.]|jgi:hypothetical protein|nr:hypothetical protein [Candidatus Cloacimonas sp.]